MLREALQCRTEGLIFGGWFDSVLSDTFTHGRVETQISILVPSLCPSISLKCRPYHRHTSGAEWPCCEVEMHHCSGYLMSQFFDDGVVIINR